MELFFWPHFQPGEGGKKDHKVPKVSTGRGPLCDLTLLHTPISKWVCKCLVCSTLLCSISTGPQEEHWKEAWHHSRGQVQLPHRQVCRQSRNQSAFDEFCPRSSAQGFSKTGRSLDNEIFVPLGLALVTVSVVDAGPAYSVERRMKHLQRKDSMFTTGRSVPCWRGVLTANRWLLSRKISKPETIAWWSNLQVAKFWKPMNSPKDASCIISAFSVYIWRTQSLESDIHTASSYSYPIVGTRAASSCLYPIVGTCTASSCSYPIVGTHM